MVDRIKASLWDVVLRWWTKRDRPAPDAISFETVVADKKRAERIARSAALMRDRDSDVMRAVACAFFAYVVDIPASEQHHHHEPFGLFDHSLEVAELALYAAQAEPFAGSDEQAYHAPLFRFATWFFGLLHDVGKIAHVTVQEPGGSRWNPYLEPLADVYARYSRNRCTLTWQRGRGLDAHKLESPYIVGKLMAPPVVRLLGPTIIREVIDQQTPEAIVVSRLIAAADQQSVREAMARQAGSAPPARPPPSSESGS